MNKPPVLTSVEERLLYAPANSQTSLRCLVIWETCHPVTLLFSFVWLYYTAG